ncbi:hypothetical protein, partial [Actinoplanes nipponensis]|uniref:hypothetical protein n=1 Tax=Actinoplanes nipponensis TaxID=135950 RepID=UPI0035EA40F6
HRPPTPILWRQAPFHGQPATRSELNTTNPTNATKPTNATRPTNATHRSPVVERYLGSRRLPTANLAAANPIPRPARHKIRLTTTD